MLMFHVVNFKPNTRRFIRNYHLLTMKSTSVISLCTSLFLFFGCLNAQEQLGWRLERYAGISGARLNPAAYSASPLQWDVQLFGATAFFSNNYAFAEHTSLWDLVRINSQDDVLARPLLEADDIIKPGQIVIDYYDDGRNRFAVGQASIEGPSFFVRLNNAHSLGLTTAFRIAASGVGVDKQLSYYPWVERPELEGFPVGEFHAGMAGYTEIGFNYVFSAYTNSGKLGIGLTAKKLSGYEGAYFDSRRSGMIVTKLSSSAVSGVDPDFHFGFTENAYQDTEWRPKVSGSGFGIDLGMVYTLEDEENYFAQFGLAILDLGKIRFNKGAQEHQIIADGERVLDWEAYRKFSSPEEFDQIVRTLSRQLLDDSLASFQDNSFDVKLPARLTLQADVKLTELFYLNGTLIQGAPFTDNAIKAGSILALTPRIEHRWGSFSLPVSFYNWRQMRVGVAARLGFLVLGTDRIGSTLGKTRFDGADFYFALKVSPFWGGERSSSRSGGRGPKIGKRGKDIPCYQF